MASRASRLEYSLNEVMTFLKNNQEPILVGVEKESPKGWYWEYLSKHTPRHRRGHCSAGQIPQMHPTWSPPTLSLSMHCSHSRILTFHLPLPPGHLSGIRWDIPFLRKMSLTPSEINYSSSGFPKHLALSQLATLHCYQCLLLCPSPPLHYKPLRAGSVLLSV